MGMVPHKDFTTEAQIIASYAALRKRIYGVQAKPIYKAVQRQEGPKLIDPRNRGKRPLWCLQDIRFDDHVRRYYGIAKTREKGAKPKVTFALEPKPLWASGIVHFNDHVVTYRRYLLAMEEGRAPEDANVKSLDEIAAEVLQRFDNLNIHMLKSASRTRPLVLPRQIVAYEMKEQRPELSWDRIGQYLGGRDHSTVLHAHGKIKRMRAEGKLNWYFNAGDAE
jgi:hypothetical protein